MVLYNSFKIKQLVIRVPLLHYIGHRQSFDESVILCSIGYATNIHNAFIQGIVLMRIIGQL